MKYKTEYYKNSAIKYYIHNNRGSGYLIIRNILYEIGLK